MAANTPRRTARARRASVPRGPIHPPPPERIEPLPTARPKSPQEDPLAQQRLRRILASPAYVRADRDVAFLERDALRPLRLQLEFLKPELILREHRVRSTILVLGGTRIVERRAALRRLRDAKAALANRPRSLERRREVRVAEHLVANSRYYDIAREFGRLVSRACQDGSSRHCVIVTGGGPGVMEAANRGAFDVGAQSAGLNITLPMEQFPNPYITPELCLQFRYFALRKMHFLLRARAVVALPGGYGTLDELFETLCLVQTRKIEPLPIVLIGERYWRRVFDAEFLVEQGTIAAEDLAIFTFVETARAAWQAITAFWRAKGHDVARGAGCAAKPLR
jgi:uncharacterized protein (TIGR00730 family)